LIFRALLHFFICVGLFSSVPRLWAEQDLLEKFLDQLKKESVQTGDLVFWASNAMDSVLIQRFTEGPFSHAGIVWIDENGKNWIFDVDPKIGLSQVSLEKLFGEERNQLIALALVRYQGRLDRKEIAQRLTEFWKRKNQIKFDHSMTLEEKKDYAALLMGEPLSLYCTEFIYRIYEGAFAGPPFFENDFLRVYTQKDALKSILSDQGAAQQFQILLGVRPAEQFEKWLMSHQSQILISTNGMIRGGGFEVLFDVQDRERLKPWAKKILQGLETINTDSNTDGTDYANQNTGPLEKN
jgi:hypothetical protein